MSALLDATLQIFVQELNLTTTDFQIVLHYTGDSIPDGARSEWEEVNEFFSESYPEVQIVEGDEILSGLAEMNPGSNAHWAWAVRTIDNADPWAPHSQELSLNLSGHQWYSKPMNMWNAGVVGHLPGICRARLILPHNDVEGGQVSLGRHDHGPH